MARSHGLARAEADLKVSATKLRRSGHVDILKKAKPPNKAAPR
jgi:hypothetical protein